VRVLRLRQRDLIDADCITPLLAVLKCHSKNRDVVRCASGALRNLMCQLDEETLQKGQETISYLMSAQDLHFFFENHFLFKVLIANVGL
jgi:hypothetical protein